MKINKYTYNWTDNNLNLITEKNCNEINLKKELQLIESAIAELYFKKQENKIGIQNLGNEIRKNATLNKIFYHEDDNITCFKMTENKRAFLNQLIKYLLQSKINKLRIYILEKEFVRNSKLVDTTSINIIDVDTQLKKLQAIFKPRFNMIQIEFIEIFNFNNHYISSEGKYSKINKK